MDQITDASMRERITERLEAIHVEVADMSGTFVILSAKQQLCRTGTARAYMCSFCFA